MTNEKSKNTHISLQEAAQLCKYSQEYLSLRARRGKLKAMKFGRNWVTTKEWLKEYLERVEEYNNSISRVVTASPPENLPVGELSFDLPRRSSLRPAFAFTLVFVLLAATVILGRKALIQNYENLAFYVAAINYQDTFKFTSDVFLEYGQWVKNQVLEIWTGNIIKP